MALPLVTKEGDFFEKSQAKSQTRSQVKDQAFKASIMKVRMVTG